MSVPRTPVPSELIDLAMSAPADLLRPGCDDTVGEWLADQSIPRAELGTFAVLTSLTDSQRELFAGDLALPTPDTYPPKSEHRISRFGILQLALAMTSGEPYGLEHQRNGVLTQDIFPKNGILGRVNSGLSAAAFDFHTDQAFSHDPSERPDVVSLACVRNREGVVTGILPVEQAVQDLPTKDVDELLQPQYQFYTGRAAEGRPADLGPVLIDDGELKVRLGGDTAGTTASAETALTSLRESLKRSAEGRGVILQPGNILTFNNQRSIHYRTAFVPESDTRQRRWLTKVYVHS